MFNVQTKTIHGVPTVTTKTKHITTTISMQPLSTKHAQWDAWNPEKITNNIMGGAEMMVGGAAGLILGPIAAGVAAFELLKDKLS